MKPEKIHCSYKRTDWSALWKSRIICWEEKIQKRLFWNSFYGQNVPAVVYYELFMHCSVQHIFAPHHSYSCRWSAKAWFVILCNISNMRRSVSSPHREESWKYDAQRSMFQNFEVFHLVMKHCVECLIFFLKQTDFMRGN